MPKPRKLATLIAGLAVSSAFLYCINPAQAWFIPLCPFRVLTGFNCPGCGSLRSLHQLLHGNIREALFLNPLAILLLPAIAYLLVCSALGKQGFSLSFSSSFVRPRFIWLLIMVILFFWVARNTPWYPFR